MPSLAQVNIDDLDTYKTSVKEFLFRRLTFTFLFYFKNSKAHYRSPCLYQPYILIYRLSEYSNCIKLGNDSSFLRLLLPTYGKTEYNPSAFFCVYYFLLTYKMYY